MPRPVQEITGQVFGRLTVIECAGKNKNGRTVWRCLCSCGRERIALGCDLRKPGDITCGICYSKEIGQRRHAISVERKKGQPPKVDRRVKHGLSNTRAYNIWLAMRTRCHNVNNPNYPYYGGRGIVICERWGVFENFLADMDMPAFGMTLERKDNDGPYSPDNCRWATRSEQNHNKRSNMIVEFHGQSMTLDQWAKELGMKYSMLYSRLVRGMSIEEAFTRPFGRWVEQ